MNRREFLQRVTGALAAQQMDGLNKIAEILGKPVELQHGKPVFSKAELQKLMDEREKIVGSGYDAYPPDQPFHFHDDQIHNQDFRWLQITGYFFNSKKLMTEEGYKKHCIDVASAHIAQQRNLVERLNILEETLAQQARWLTEFGIPDRSLKPIHTLTHEIANGSRAGELLKTVEDHIAHVTGGLINKGIIPPFATKAAYAKAKNSIGT